MSDKNQDWWRGSVTYQIYPRSFMDSNGDGIGDIKGITSKLDYIADLGVDAIWLSPVFTSPMKDMGYDVSDYRNIDPTFGTLSDFDEMIAKAHSLGLKVIIDQVLSHCSNEHPFFLEARMDRDNPKSEWFVWADPNPDGSAPNNWQSIFGGIAWEWEPRRKQYYFHNFLKEQPDLNFHNPEVQQYALDTMRFWLDRGVDGFRLDTVNFYFHDKLLRNDAADFRPEAREAFNPYYMLYHLFSKNQPENIAFLERMRDLCDEYDDRAMVGEVGEWHHPLELMGKYTTGKRLHMAYSFDMLGPKFSAQHFRKTIQDFFEIAPNGWPCWAFSNHDVTRQVSRWKEHGYSEETLAKLCGALLLSLEGSICLYQGEELGQTDTDLTYAELTDPQGITFWPEDKGRDGCRTPMIWNDELPNGGFSEGSSTWLPIKAPQRFKAVSNQDHDNSVLKFYQKMLRLRREFSDLRHGKTNFFDLPEPLLAFTRGEKILCVFNLSTQQQSVELKEETMTILSTGAKMIERRLVLDANGVFIGSRN